MSDNLKLLKEQIETDIDPSGAPGSILAENHQDILFSVLNKTGKYSGFYFVANKVLTTFTNGSMSWENNALNASGDFTIKVSKLTSDLNNFGHVLELLSEGDLIKFKDFVGRTVLFEFKSYASGQDGSLNDIFIITLSSKAENINYTYQDNEQRICGFEIVSSGTGGGSSNGEVRIGNLWFYPPNGQTITDDQEFRGFPTPGRYVVGTVLDATDFDIDDDSKANLLVNNYS